MATINKKMIGSMQTKMQEIGNNLRASVGHKTKLELVDYSSHRLEDIWDIYESSFPPDERRDLDKEKEFLKEKKFKLYAIITEKNETAGFAVIWEFNNFSFGEHFAIKKEFRGRGYGPEAFMMLKENLKFPVVIEVEPETLSPTAAKRINFYKRLGAKANPFDYIQPAYSATKKPIPMIIMSYPDSLSESMYDKIREKIHTEVYGLKGPLKSL